MANPRPAAAEPQAKAVAGLRKAAEEAALRLSGDDKDADLEELAQALKKLSDTCAKIGRGAQGPWKKRLDEALKHFREAQDLLDDGEPADAVALEVMAAREGLR